MSRWLLLLYRLPAEPSAPRVAVWRALRRMDGALLQKGAYLAPADARAGVELQALAHDIRNFGGEASVMEVARADNGGELARRVEAERAALEAKKAPASDPTPRRRKAKKGGKRR